jgi:hypothetical protein
LDSATVLEKLEAGPDTLFIGFNEKIDGLRLPGQSLLLIKTGAPAIALNVLTADEIPGRGWRVTFADLGAQSPAAGDSLKINAAGPLTDAVGNHAHPLNPAVVLKLKIKPKPPVLTMKMDQPYLTVKNGAQLLDFVILSANPDSSWTPVLGSAGGSPAADCSRVGCGAPVQGGAGLAFDRPAFTIVTDRGFKYSVTIFSNLGEFVNGFSGEITNAQLGLDERNLPVTGSPALFSSSKGRYGVKISWNAKSLKGMRAASGAYIAKISAASQSEDADGKPKQLSESHAIRFGILRQ